MQTNSTPLPRPSHAPRGDNRKLHKMQRDSARRVKSAAKLALLLSLASFSAQAAGLDYVQTAVDLARSAAATDGQHYAVDDLQASFILPPCATEDSDNCFWDAQERGNRLGRSFVTVNGTRLFVER